MKMRDRLGKKKIPGWLFLSVTVIYNELLLHLWVMDGLHWGRLGVVVTFALGCGCALGLLTSLVPGEKVQKYLTMGVGFLIAAFWVAEYFVLDSYGNFMNFCETARRKNLTSSFLGIT